jgi:hypothetical protein
MEKEPQLLDQYKSTLKEKVWDEDVLRLLDPMEIADERQVVNELINKLNSLIP